MLWLQFTCSEGNAYNYFIPEDMDGCCVRVLINEAEYLGFVEFSFMGKVESKW